MANTLSFDQISTVLNSITEQATGASLMKAVDTSSFVAQANVALLSGYDNLTAAISQVMDKTIFSTRPYTAKFPKLYKDTQRWGNHTRKLQMLDDEFEDDSRLPLTDGASVDMYTVKKGKVLQTNFYGGQVYSKHRTYFKDQLDTAFRSPDELGQFLTMYTQNLMDEIEQAHESLARGCVSNFIAAKYIWESEVENGTENYTGKHVVKLVTQYNDETGKNLTSDTVRQPENFVDFIKWAFATIQTYADFMTDRHSLYHANIKDKVINRHTPYSLQHLYLFSSDSNRINTEVLSAVFHDEYLKKIDFEKVNFWQNIGTPGGVKTTPSYIDPTGMVKKGEEQAISNIFAVLFDDEAMGYTMKNQWSATTPFNARGGYYNVWYHFTDQYWNDLTENALVFTLE